MIISKLNRYSLWHLFLITVFSLLWYIFSLVVSMPLAVGAISLVVFQLMFLFYIYNTMRGFDCIIRELSIYIKGKDLFWGLISALINLRLAILIAPLLPEIDSIVDKIPKSLNMTLILLFLSICIIGPLMEELLFRGYLWKILEEKKIKPILILIITSLMFSLFHFELHRSPFLFVSGIIFGYSRFKTGRIGISLSGHIINNVIVFLVSII